MLELQLLSGLLNNMMKLFEFLIPAEIFNLAGQKIDKSYKGIVIQNGKKFVQK